MEVALLILSIWGIASLIILAEKESEQGNEPETMGPCGRN